MTVGWELVALQIFNGFTMALAYTLVALGLSTTMGLLGIVNFAHGALYMMGGYFTYILASSMGFGTGLACATSLCALLGIILFLCIYKPLETRSPIQVLVALIGVLLIFEQLVRDFLGAEPKMLQIPFYLSGPIVFNLLGSKISFSKYYLFITVVSSVILILVYCLFHRTNIGIRGLASIQNKEVASLLGVDLTKVGIIIFVLGSILAGIGGGLLGPVFSIYPTVGGEILGFIFVIVIVGGVGSLIGTFFASLLFCLIRSIGCIFLSPNYVEIIAYCILIAIIAFKPRGLLGREKVLD